MLPYDSNEVLGAGMRGGRPPGAPGGPPQGEPSREGPPGQGRRGPGRDQAGDDGRRESDLSPLALLDARDRPLARLLKVPAWRAAFLAHLHAIAQDALDWKVIGALAEPLYARLDPLVRDDEKSPVHGHDAFTRSLEALRRAIDTRRKTILERECMRGPWPTIREARAAAALREGDRAVLEVSARIEGEATPAVVLLHVTTSRRSPSPR